MKLAWHIFRKDFRRLRWALLGWAVLFLLQYGAFRMLLLPANHEESPLRGAVIALGWLELGVAWLLAPLLIHDDPLVGDVAAWRTRPISGARLLGAKLLGGLLLLCVPPTLLLLPWWIHFGFGAVDILLTALASLLGFALLTSLAAAVAVLTGDLPRFIGWSLLLGAGIGLLLLTVANAPAVVGDEGLPFALMASRLWLAAAVALVGVVLVIALQFLSRRYVLTLILAGGTAIAAGLVSWAWPWTLDEMRAAAGTARFAPAHLSAKLRSATLFVPPPTNAGSRASLQLAFDFSASDLAQGDDPGWSSLDVSLRHGDQGRLPLTAVLKRIAESDYDTPNAHAQPLIEGRGAQRAAESTGYTTRVELPGALVPRLRDGSAALTAEAKGALWRGQREALMPLRAEVSDHLGLSVTRVLRVKGPPAPSDDYGDFIEWVETSPFLAPENLIALFHTSSNGPRRETETLVEGREALVRLHPAWFWRFGRPHSVVEVPVGLVLFEGNGADFHPDRQNGRESGLSADPARFAQARFARVAFTESERLDTPVNVAGFAPDLVIEGDIDAAVRRAGVEHKRVLVMAHRGAFEPTLPKVPDAWNDPAVRELVRRNFVCAQVFASTDPRFAGGAWGQLFPRLVILTSDGARQDAFNEVWSINRWTRILPFLAGGGTYVDWLRQELAQPDTKERRDALAEALIARGDIAAGIDLMLRLPPPPEEVRRWWQLNLMPGVARDLASLVTTTPEARGPIRQQLEAAREDLRRDPRSTEAARRLFSTTYALKDRALWADFPRRVAKENAERWRLVMAWIGYSNNREQIPLVPEEVEWDTFFHEGEGWVRDFLAAARRDARLDYQNVAFQWRILLIRVGIRGVNVLAKAGEKERAEKLAADVRRLGGYRGKNTRAALAEALQGRAQAGDFNIWEDWRQ